MRDYHHDKLCLVTPFAGDKMPFETSNRRCERGTQPPISRLSTLAIVDQQGHYAGTVGYSMGHTRRASAI